MTFPNAGLLAALVPLLAAPIVIHFLNKRLPRRFPFSSVEHLRKTAAERSRLYRWRHRILALVRTLFLALLLLVFLRPVLDRFGNAARPEGQRRILLLVDTSASMEYRKAGLSARARARIEADKILELLENDDRANVVAVGHAPTLCFTAFSPDRDGARRFLETLPAGIGKADFNLANATAARLLEAESGPAAEIYYLSDFQRKNWSHVDFEAVRGKARLFFVDLAEPDAANHGILGAEVLPSHILAGDSVPIEVTVGNFSPAPLRDTLTLRVDDRVQLQQPVDVGPWSSARVIVPVPAGDPGRHVCDIRLPRDELAEDDRWALVYAVSEKEEIVTLSADPDPTKDPVRYLHTALNPFPGLAGSLLPRHVPTARLDAAALAGARKLFVTRSGVLDDAGARVVAGYLQHGGSVVWFLDDEQDAANLERLEQAAGAPFLPLRVGPLRRSEKVGIGFQQIATGDFQSRWLRLFKGSLRQQLGGLEFYDVHSAGGTDQGRVILRFGDETPAMAVAEHGLGTLLLMNLSVSEFSSNLARQRIFPAWIQDLVKQLDVSQPAAASFVAGQSIEAEVWKDDLRRHSVRSPSGRIVETVEEPMGDRSRIRFPADELGFYALAGARDTHRWAVNVDPVESDLRPVDRAQLPVPDDQASDAAFVAGHADYRQVAQGRPVLHWFLFAALAVLGLELLLQLSFRRLAP